MASEGGVEKVIYGCLSRMKDLETHFNPRLDALQLSETRMFGWVVWVSVVNGRAVWAGPDEGYGGLLDNVKKSVNSLYLREHKRVTGYE